jgi:hypothetical protein
MRAPARAVPMADVPAEKHGSTSGVSVTSRRSVPMADVPAEKHGVAFQSSDSAAIAFRWPTCRPKGRAASLHGGDAIHADDARCSVC